MKTLTGCQIIVTGGPIPSQEFELSGEEVIFGRDASADIVIAAPAVSRRHARLACQENKYILEDLGSSNGTFLNGIQVFGAVTLYPGDQISFSQEITLVFNAPSSKDAPTQLVGDVARSDKTMLAGDEKPAGQVARPRLIVSVAGSAPETYTLQKDYISIGREADNDIVIPSRIMSRRHARLEWAGAGYQLVLLPGVTNPFWIEGRPATDLHQLRHREELRIDSDTPNLSVSIVYHAPLESAPRPTPRVATADAADASDSPHTMLDADFDSNAAMQAIPPQLIITMAGSPARIYALEKASITIGRAEDNDIVIPSQIVSRHHGRLELRNKRYEILVLPQITNALLYEGRPLERHRLHHDDILRIDSTLPGMMVTMEYHSPSEKAATADFHTISFGEKNLLTFGRDPSNDVQLDVPTISHYHAQVERIGRRYRISDLNSANGTFVNDDGIEGDVWLADGDTIRIGPYRFITGQDQLAQYDETGGLHVDALGLNKWVRKDLNILKNISLTFQPREFIVIVGQSGGGKSTLVDSIAGYRPATHGKVTVNGIDVYKNFDAIRNEIGYVPQKDIIHMELTTYQALDYAARLRMPRDTTKAERHQRIMEVLQDLDLVHRKDVQISGLSGGQQKRVSIGVELLTKPGLFFLDEPTSGLDPGTETSFMHLMRRLADQGRTIILVTHATKNVMLADKVVFLSRGGYLSWFGPPDEALEFFDQFRSERERRIREMEFDQIYSILDDSSRGTPEQWAERYQANTAFQKYIVKPLTGSQAPAPAAPQQKAARSKSRGAKASSLRQFFILSARNIKILTRDRSSLVLMLLAAPLVACLDFVLAPMMGTDLYDINIGNASNASITLFMMTIYCLLVAGLSQMREFVKEADIYKRERLVNLKILPYVASKVWIAVMLSFYHAAAYAIIHYAAFKMPGSTLDFGLVYVTLVLAALAGMVGGLLASALASSASSAPLIMILLIVPQIVLSGALAPVPSHISAPASTRWAFESFVGITGIGSDVAADPCWALTKELRESMTLEDKENYGCRCMGIAVFDPESCDFPGIQQYYKPEIDQAPPDEPPPLAEKPPEPEIPSPPSEPEDQHDSVAVAQYLTSLQAYQEDVGRIQLDYKNQMSIYEAEVQVYKAEAIAYQKDLAGWNIARNAATGAAEGLISSIRMKFGWAWVNKADSAIYWSWLFTTWVAQLVIVTVYVAVILVLIKRKDVN